MSIAQGEARIVLNCSKLLSLILYVFFLVLPSPAGAHPHAWIDLRSYVVLDNDGNVSAIEAEWLFDDFYSLFVTEELGKDGATEEAALKELAKTNLNNLREYDYFTEVRVDGEKVELGKVTEYDSELRNGRLWMRFIVPLKTTVDAISRRLTYAVFDPAYYIEILHLEGDVVGFTGVGANDCTALVVPPKPTTEAIMLAQASEIDAKPDNALGRIFAEQVEVSCR